MERGRPVSVCDVLSGAETLQISRDDIGSVDQASRARWITAAPPIQEARTRWVEEVRERLRTGDIPLPQNLAFRIHRCARARFRLAAVLPGKRVPSFGNHSQARRRAFRSRVRREKPFRSWVGCLSNRRKGISWCRSSRCSMRIRRTTEILITESGSLRARSR